MTEITLKQVHLEAIVTFQAAVRRALSTNRGCLALAANTGFMLATSGTRQGRDGWYQCFCRIYPMKAGVFIIKEGESEEEVTFTFREGGKWPAIRGEFLITLVVTRH